MKNILKSFKLNENNISMLLGAAVIVIVGFLVVNYFRNLEDSGTTLPSGASSTEQTATKLPATHTVESGETLWSIAEKYYKSGYNWVDIKAANKLSDASIITKGQQLTIPEVSARTATVKVNTPVASAAPSATTIAASTATPEAVISPTNTPATTKGGLPVSSVNETPEVNGDSYTIIHGDNLWKIAVKAYGDGYKWTKIAKANHLSHPGTIHAGNVLQIPR